MLLAEDILENELILNGFFYYPLNQMSLNIKDHFAFNFHSSFLVILYTIFLSGYAL